MHYLVVARTKDHPFWDLLNDALTYDDGDEVTIGKWEQIYANKDEMVADNKNEISAFTKENKGIFDEGLCAFMDANHLVMGGDNAIYERTSAQFDYCVTCYKTDSEELRNIMKYKDVVEKAGDYIYAFITADYGFHYTEDEKCPFADDDLVYVIDGHSQSL